MKSFPHEILRDKLLTVHSTRGWMGGFYVFEVMIRSVLRVAAQKR